MEKVVSKSFHQGILNFLGWKDFAREQLRIIQGNIFTGKKFHILA